MSEPDQIILTCPSCGGKLRAPRSTLGSEVGCPSCQGSVTVREPAPYIPTPMIVDSKRRLGVMPRGGETAPVEEGGFKDRLRNTAESDFVVDPLNPTMKRRDLRKAKHGDALTDWDNQSRRRHSRTRSRRIHLLLWGTAFMALATLIAIFWQRTSQRPRLISTPAKTVATPLEIKNKAFMLDPVWDITTKFCSAKTAEDLIPLIREADRVAPLLRKYYKTRKEWSPVLLGKKPDISVLEAHRNMVMFELPLADYSVRPIALEDTPLGFRVDWESFVYYSELSWEELRHKRPREPVTLRAVIKREDYFNYDFPSSQTHSCYRLSVPSESHSLYGYVPKNSEVEVQISSTMLLAVNIPIVVRVRYPENGTDPQHLQVEITEVLEKGWIFREDDLPEIPSGGPLGPGRPSAQSSPDSGSSRPAVLPSLKP